KPLSVLEDIKKGTLTREHVEALQKVYPHLYNQIRVEVLEQLRDKSETDIPYNRRVLLSILLNIPGDASLLGKNIEALQANFLTPQEKEAMAEQEQLATQEQLKQTVGAVPMPVG